MELILASKSPRRKELLSKFGLEFTVMTSEYKEELFTDNPIETAVAFAKGKAESVFKSLQVKKDKMVLGADTVVFHCGKILGKARNKAEAREMLVSLSGKTHSVITGYAVVDESGTLTGYSKSEVTFNVLSDKMIDEYIKSGLCYGKAGSYGIQDGFDLVKEYKGSLNNVIGLPTECVVPILKNKMIKKCK